MFNHIYVESEVADTEYANRITSFFSNIEKTEIDLVDNYFGKVKKPYLQKRDNLNLFVGKKRGSLIKEAPDAYGVGSGDHFYFIHAYNCIYECEYCFLQGYFHSPDIVLFVNHEDIISEMEVIARSGKEVWFHAGEFSDSLALSHITKEWSQYWEFFKKYPNAHLELRSKSTNIKEILELEPLDNVVITFSLSDSDSAKKFDRKTPPIAARLKAIEKLATKGFSIGIHFDPIIYRENIFESYQQLVDRLFGVLPDSSVKYFSLGVVRYTKEVYRCVEKNYPNSDLVKQPYQKSFDGKVRYSRPLRGKILSTIKSLLEKNYAPEKIYLCMEDN